MNEPVERSKGEAPDSRSAGPSDLGKASAQGIIVYEDDSDSWQAQLALERWRQLCQS